jgi:hypothetical protein
MNSPAHITPAPQIPASLRALLTHLIDYAGLFPPAGLGMREAVQSYARSLGSAEAWMLARFIVPSSRLGEFRAAQQKLDVNECWALSVLIGADAEAELRAVQSFNGERGREAHIDTVEQKAGSAEEVARLQSLIPAGMQAYYEVAANASEELLTAIRESGGRAKVRTGALVPDGIPSVAHVADFITRCADAGVAFKATAGLHHPVRCMRPLTYAADAPSGTMHGFLNVFLAAVLAGEKIEFAGRSAEEARRELLTAVLEQGVGEYFRFDDDQAQVNAVISRGAANTHFEVNLSTERIRQARERLAISFGSCSFEEPVEDLRALKLL